MIKVIQLTKKLSLQLSARKVLANFTLIDIRYDRFIDYSVYFTFCNMTLRFTYENEKQREALKNLHKCLSEMEDDIEVI
jgi:hypothetical protein